LKTFGSSKDSRMEFVYAYFSFHVGLLVIKLSSLKLHTDNNTVDWQCDRNIPYSQ